MENEQPIDPEDAANILIAQQATKITKLRERLKAAKRDVKRLRLRHLLGDLGEFLADADFGTSPGTMEAVARGLRSAVEKMGDQTAPSAVGAGVFGQGLPGGPTIAVPMALILRYGGHGADCATVTAVAPNNTCDCGWSRLKALCEEMLANANGAARHSPAADPADSQHPVEAADGPEPHGPVAE